MAQDGVVEGPDVEGRPERRRRFASQPLDLPLTDFVCKCLTRPADVAVRLDPRVGVREAGVEEQLHGPLAGPVESMNAGVDDESRRPPGLAVEHPKSLGRVEIEAHLIGQPLRVQTPALHVSHPRHARAHAPEGVEARMFGLEGDLEMMARHGFVEARVGKADVASTRQVVGVDVVDARAAAVDRRRVVVGRRRVGFLERLHRSNFAAGVREAAEVARGGGESALDLTAGAVKQLVD